MLRHTVSDVAVSLGDLSPRELKSILARYRGGSTFRSLSQLLSTLLLFTLGWLAMWWSFEFSYAWTLLLAIPTAGFAVRLFILQHDCGHGSFFHSMTANRLVGNMLGVLTLTPYECWRRQHAAHHATSGQLDHRGIGDIRTMTVTEYQLASRWQRFVYRLYRHPVVLFGVGPFLHFAILQRFTGSLPRHWRKERWSVHQTNLAILALVLLMAWLVGPWTLAALHLPIVLLAGSCGVWLFYIQHQFDPTYWEHDDQWEHATAAIAGSSHLALPAPLAWLTANIGLHHIHHLDSRIANYSLAACYRAHAQLQTAQRLTLRSSLACTRLKLWDERSGRLVGFADVVLPARQTARGTQVVEERST
ncbi:MAG: fatty acid desaturase [Pirellulales bacterium]|nr:fatty acid desaturase [Pirellulales bacterium]